MGMNKLGKYFLFFLILQFFRIPNREVNYSENMVLCPADGKIVAIEEVDEPEYFKEKKIQVSIFMSPLNVHANYFPISGNVSYVRYHPGLFLVAWHPKSSTKNERSTVVVKDAKNREVFGRPIGKNQAIQFPISKAYARTIAAEYILVDGCKLFDSGKSCGKEANISKMLCAEASWEAAEATMQTFGGFSFSEEYNIERKYRETRLYQIAPVSTNMILAYISHKILGLPRSY